MRCLAAALTLLAAAVAAAAAAPAAAEPPVVPDRAIVVGRVGDLAWTDAPTEARADQTAEVAVVVIAHAGKHRVVLAPAGVTALRLAGHAVPAADRAPLADARVQWSTVEPHGFRTSAAKNGATSAFYSNVSTEPATFGRWLGFDTIDYFERVVRPWGDAQPIAAAVTAGEPDAQPLAGLGTTRFKAEVELPDHARLASPGAEATDTYGITAAVHRVSIRRGDDFLGWLSAYLLVPEVFGSAGAGRGHQTDRFTGADCADVLVGALRRTGRTDLEYTNVAGLPAYTTRVAAPVELDEHGTPTRAIAGVQPGDLIRIDYGGELRHHTPRDWDHVAALWEDRSDPDGPAHGGPDGKLDGFDLVIHMGHPRLVIEPLAAQAPATIDVLRWRAQK
jgi:hypothetical protein